MRDAARSKQIHESAIEVAKHYVRAEQALLATLLEVERDQTFELYGFTFLTPYCVQMLNLSVDVAKVFVRVVRKSHHVPELAESVMTGLSVYKAKVIASVITPDNKDEWLEKAQRLSKADLEKAVSKSSGNVTKHVCLDMTYESFERMVRAQELYSSKLEKFASREDAVDWALREVIYRHDPIEKAKRSRDSSVQHERVRRDNERCQARYSDGTQCQERKWLHQHHIIHKKDGGPDTLENLITLCASHHRMLHRH